jgi:hypothetical protein
MFIVSKLVLLKSVLAVVAAAAVVALPSSGWMPLTFSVVDTPAVVMELVSVVTIDFEVNEVLSVVI